MSGKVWEPRRVVRYHLQRWPSQRSMKRARARVKAFTGRSQVGKELRAVIDRLNLFLLGWGNYFRTGNAAESSATWTRVAWRLKRLLIKKRGRNLRAGHADRWTELFADGPQNGGYDEGLLQDQGGCETPGD